MISRRTLLKALLATGAVTTTTFFLLKDDDVEINLVTGYDYDNLSPEQALVLSTFLLAILDGLPIHEEQELLSCLVTVDQTLNLIPVDQKAEFMDLLGLLTNSLSRLVLARGWVNWSDVETEEVDAILNDWSTSSLVLLNAAYDGMKKLLIASWYGNEEHWEAIGYPGPPEFIWQ